MNELSKIFFNSVEEMNECYERGYNQAIDDVVFELNNQDVDSDIISLIEGV